MGHSRVNMNSSVAATVIAAVPHPAEVARISRAADAITSPAVTGTSPRCTMRRHVAARKRYQSR
jgi:hypothetical protein